MKDTFPSTFRSPNSKIRLILLVSFIVITGTALRFYHIGAKSLWCDEVGSLMTVKKDLGYVLKNTIEVDAHPPLYYLGLWFWTRAGSSSEAGARTFSAAASSLAILAFYYLGVLLKDKKFGVALSALASVSAYQIYFAQEARLYALVSLIFLINLIFILRFLGHGKKTDIMALTAINILGCYTYVYYLFVMVIQGLYVAAGFLKKDANRNMVKSFALSQAAVFLAFCPWILVIIKKMGRVSVMPGQSGTLLGWSIPNAFLEYFGGIWRPEAEWQYAVILGSIAGILVWCFRISRADKKAALIVSMLAGLWILLAVLPVKVHVFESKHLIFVSPLLLICLCYVLMGTASRALKIYLLTLYLGVNLCSLAVYFDSSFEKEDWRKIVREVESRAKPDECVLFNPGFAGYAFDCYSSGKLYRFGLVPDSVKGEINAISSQFPKGWLVEYRSRTLDPSGSVSKFLTERFGVQPVMNFNGYMGTVRISEVIFK